MSKPNNVKTYNNLTRKKRRKVRLEAERDFLFPIKEKKMNNHDTEISFTIRIRSAVVGVQNNLMIDGILFSTKSDQPNRLKKMLTDLFIEKLDELYKDYDSMITNKERK